MPNDLRHESLNTEEEATNWRKQAFNSRVDSFFTVEHAHEGDHAHVDEDAGDHDHEDKVVFAGSGAELVSVHSATLPQFTT